MSTNLGHWQTKLDFAWFFGGYTSEEVASLRNDLTLVGEHVDEVGIMALTRLSEECKEAYGVFADNKTLPSQAGHVRMAPETRQHAHRVMTSIVDFIDKLQNKDEFLDYAMALSAVHSGRGIKPDYILSLMACLRQSLFDQLISARQALGPTESMTQPVSPCPVTVTNRLNGGGSFNSKHCSTCRCRRGSLTSSGTSQTAADSRYNRPEFDVWNKLFMTLALALIYGMERSASLRSHGKKK